MVAWTSLGDDHGAVLAEPIADPKPDRPGEDPEDELQQEQQGAPLRQAHVGDHEENEERGADGLAEGDGEIRAQNPQQ